MPSPTEAGIAAATEVATTVVNILGNQIGIFWVGVFGAIVVEVAAFAGFYDAAHHPEKYRRLGFYLSKAVLAVSGGVLVVIHGVTTAPAALQIGASASALVLVLSKKETA
jgi:hypothetical protein